MFELHLCCCGEQATSKLSYAEDIAERQNASAPSSPSVLPSSLLTDQSYQTPPVDVVTQLVSVPEDVQLPSPTISKDHPIPIPPLHASTPGHQVSSQHCWTRCKADHLGSSGAGANGCLFQSSTGLCGRG